MSETHLASACPWADTELARFIQRHGYPDLAALHAGARDRPERFWAQVAADYGPRWQRPPERVLDLSRGLPWPRWFVGGELDLYDNLIGELARTDPGRPVLSWEADDGERREYSASALDLEARRLASGLAALGVARGDRVAVYLPMLPETVVVLLAVARLGAIVLPLFSGYGADAVASRLSDGEAALLVCADGYLRRGKRVDMLGEARAALARCPGLSRLLVVPRLAEAAPPESPAAHWREWDYHRLLATSEPQFGPAPFAADTPLMVMYTSGTTGRPKGVLHTHAGFPLKAAQDMAMAFDLKPGDRLMWVTDMGWMMGPWLVYGGLLRGAALCLYEGTPDHPGPDRLWELVRRHRLTHLGLSPTLARLLMAAGDGALPAAGALDSLRVFGSTGEPWNEAPWRWLFERVGAGRFPIVNYSGGTEIGGGILAALAGLPHKPCGFTGPIPGMQADAVDTEGQSVIGRPGADGAGEVGELVLRAPWPGMAAGFWRDEARYLASYWSRFPGLWVHGDWARVDTDGHWFIQGRSDDTLKVAGKRVGPAEYESALVDHALVAEAMAVGVPDPIKGEAVVCFVTLADPVLAASRAWPVWEAELGARVAARLGKPLAPSRVFAVAALPKTRNGKILRRLARAAWLDEPLGDVSALEDGAALAAIRACRPAPPADA